MVETGQRAPEHLRSSPELTGLQGRLLLADSNPSLIKPQTAVPDSVQLKPMSERTWIYEQSAQALLKQRKADGEKRAPGESFQVRYKAWEGDFVQGVNATPDDRLENFYDPLFTQIGIDRQQSGGKITSTDARKVYKRYFYAKEEQTLPEKNGVKQFVADVLAGYRSNGNVDMDRLRTSLPELRRFAGNFSDDPADADLVVNLVLAEANAANNADFVKNERSRINNLVAEEVEMLKRIRRANRPEIPEDETDSIYPIDKYKSRLQYMIRENDKVLISAGTGTGKSTRGVLAMRETLKPGDKLIVTEPTQSVVEKTAKYVAQLEGVKIGEEIGFQYRGNKKTSKKTDTTFETERTRLLKMYNDPALEREGTGTIILVIDEAHKMTKDMELIVAQIDETNRLRQERGWGRLVTVFMSATANEEEIEKKQGLDPEDTIRVEGKTYEVKVDYSPKNYTDEELPGAAAEAAVSYTQYGHGHDILIPVAGTEDIEATMKALEQQDFGDQQVEFVSYKSGDNPDILNNAAPNDVQRIMVATNAVETGITFPRPVHVINTGRGFTDQVDPTTGLPSVIKEDLPQATIKQWIGRAGRLAEGTAYNLFTEENFESRPEFPKSQMQKSDITDVILLLKKNGKDINDLTLMSGEIGQEKIDFSLINLHIMGAIDDEGNLTDIGERMADLPVDYHFSRMIAEAEKREKGVNQITTLAAMEGISVVLRTDEARDKANKRFKNETSDFLTALNMWNEFARFHAIIQAENDRSKHHGLILNWQNETGLNYNAFSKVQRAKQNLLKDVQTDHDQSADDDELGRLIYEGYKDRLMTYIPVRKSYIWQNKETNDYDIRIGRASVLSGKKPDYIIAGRPTPLRVNQKAHTTYRKRVALTTIVTSESINVTNCQVVKPEWLEDEPEGTAA